MTVWMFLAVHVMYGALMARATVPRMLAEGAVLGAPLVVSLAPVALVSVPVGAMLSRFVGVYFLQGIPIEHDPIAFERFHLGVLLLVGLAVVGATILGHFFAVASASRDHRRVALLPVLFGALVIAVDIALDPRRVAFIDDTPVVAHPVGLLTLAVVACLGAALLWGRAKGGVPATEHA